MAKPKDMIYVVDPSPLNWLYVLFNTMEEWIRPDVEGRIILNLAEDYHWLDDLTLEFKLRRNVFFHNGESLSALNIKQSFNEMTRWTAPHPPGTWLNFPPGIRCQVIDDHTVRFHFPVVDGLALGKMRAFHIGNIEFWKKLGFGYAKLGSGEGRW